jgi:hypothetical protein
MEVEEWVEEARQVLDDRRALDHRLQPLFVRSIRNLGGLGSPAGTTWGLLFCLTIVRGRAPATGATAGGILKWGGKKALAL